MVCLMVLGLVVSYGCIRGELGTGYGKNEWYWMWS
jgi:hypothetical protein